MFAVVLLALPFPDRQGLVPFVELRARTRAIPIVVLCASADEPLGLKSIQLGATDYLIREQLYGILVARCLRHAVETERLREVLARTSSEAPRFDDAEKDPDAKPASLSKALPERFAELVALYGQCLDDAVEETLYRVEHPIAECLRNLAASAGELRAAPRDLVEIHSQGLELATAEIGAQRAKLYHAEGRLRLLEAMGYLATFYRRAWIQSELSAPNDGPRHPPHS